MIAQTTRENYLHYCPKVFFSMLIRDICRRYWKNLAGVERAALSQCAYAIPSSPHVYILPFHVCERTANCYRRSKTIQAQDASNNKHFIARYILDGFTIYELGANGNRDRTIPSVSYTLLFRLVMFLKSILYVRYTRHSDCRE